MSTPLSGDEPYPGQDYSVSQLLHAIRRKLEATTSYGRTATSSNAAEADALEHDALQVLRLVRSMKNTFAPVNKIPPEVLTLVPDHWEGSDGDEALINLTHVCRGWRKLFISHTSLWTRLDCMNVDKTRAYIERSKTSPLEIYLKDANNTFCLVEAFLLAVPHIGRLRELSVSGNPAPVLPVLAEHFSCHVPLLSKLDINLVCDQASILPGTLFNGDLSSLRELRLTGVTTPLPWRGLSNLTTFSLCHVPEDGILLTQLLDFFESAPHLRHIRVHDSIPSSRNAPTEQVVSLPHLKNLSIITQTTHSILLDHLSIPAGASLHLEFAFSGRESSILSYLPNPPDGLRNLSDITAVNLCFGSGQRSVRLSGPSGELYVLGKWTSGGERSTYGTGEFLRSLDRFDISRTRWLAITLCGLQPSTNNDFPITARSNYKTLCSMKNLRTLTLSRSKNLIFILALNPDQNPSKTVLCPKLEEIILYIDHPFDFHLNELLSMTEERASRGAKLSAITIVNTEAFAPTKTVFQLRKYVSRVEYKFVDAPPEWDTLPSQVM